MHIVESIARVLIVGLIFGAGLPALFAVGMVAHSNGVGGENADGTVSAPNPMLRAVAYAIFGLVILAIIVGLLWVTRQTIYFHFGIKIFPFGYK